ncbi:MAG: hypothetical protein JNM17_29625 [Archangium sp.]|nr:hypothetical protein [Archangium sp.]
MLLALALTLLTQTPAPQKVTVGLHLRNIEGITLEENAYHANFVLWAMWDGDRDPTKSLRFTNLLEAWALTLNPVFDEPISLPDGRKYQRFTGEGRFFHKFELGSFPLDKQQVVLELEDAQRGDGELTLTVDPESSVADDLKVPGWILDPVGIEEAVQRTSASTFGLQPGGAASKSGLPDAGAKKTTLRFGAHLQRPRRVFFVTMFPPILLVMMCCWFIFFLRPVHVEARVGTVITALLTIVFLQLAFTDDLPYLGTTVLLDQVFNFSYVIITGILLECVVVMRWHDHFAALEASLASMPESERLSVDAERRAARTRYETIDRRAKQFFPLAYAIGCAAIIAVHLS